MNWRRVIYIALVVFVAAVIFQNIPENKQVLPETLLDQEVVLDDFRQLEHPIYEEEKYQPSFIYFPYDYTGDKGDEFYLTIKNAQGITTIKYVLEKDSSGKLKYLVKNRWPEVSLPTERFESYQYQDNGWIKINQP